MDVREKLIEILEEPCGGLYPACELADYLLSHGVTVQEWIDKAPTVDAVPVSELEKLRNFLYAEDLIFMRGLAELNKLIANYGAKMDEEVSE